MCSGPPPPYAITTDLSAQPPRGAQIDALFYETALFLYRSMAGGAGEAHAASCLGR